MLENLIARICGPALAGIKPSNIVACHKSKIDDIHSGIERLNGELNCKDIYFEILCECEKRVLVMVYRKKVLRKQLLDIKMNEFLVSFGYPENATVKEYIDFLKERMKDEAFPHEIGAFLGYPLHDIYGFINHRDEGCILTGEWKVYKDAENAKKLFLRYESCRKALAKRLFKGLTLAQIFCAA